MHDYKLCFDNKVIIELSTGEKLEFKNKLTSDAEKILAANLKSSLHTSGESNKILGIILSTKKLTPSKTLTISDIMSESDTYVVLGLNSITYLGSGVIKYGARYNFTYSNSSGVSKSFKTMGLITGYNISTPASFKLFSVLSTNFTVANGGSFTSDYLLSASIKR